MLRGVESGDGTIRVACQGHRKLSPIIIVLGAMHMQVHPLDTIDNLWPLDQSSSRLLNFAMLRPAAAGNNFFMIFRRYYTYPFIGTPQ